MSRSPIARIYQTTKHIAQSTSVRNMSSSQRPTGLIANSGIELLTFGTPNGHKVSILLEELKEAYGKEYVFQSINIMQNIQKEPWFTKHSPNGRVREEKRRDSYWGWIANSGVSRFQLLSTMTATDLQFLRACQS